MDGLPSGLEGECHVLCWCYHWVSRQPAYQVLGSRAQKVADAVQGAQGSMQASTRSEGVVGACAACKAGLHPACHSTPSSAMTPAQRTAFVLALPGLPLRVAAVPRLGFEGFRILGSQPRSSSLQSTLPVCAGGVQSQSCLYGGIQGSSRKLRVQLRDMHALAPSRCVLRLEGFWVQDFRYTIYLGNSGLTVAHHSKHGGMHRSAVAQQLLQAWLQAQPLPVGKPKQAWQHTHRPKWQPSAHCAAQSRLSAGHTERVWQSFRARCPDAAAEHS